MVILANLVLYKPLGENLIYSKNHAKTPMISMFLFSSFFCFFQKLVAPIAPPNRIKRIYGTKAMYKSILIYPI